MKNAKDFDVRQFVPEGSTNGTTVADGDVRPSKRSVSSERSELTERNEVAGQTVPTPSSGRVEEITPTPLSEQTAKPRQSTSTSTTERSVPSQQIERPQQNDSTQSTEPPQSTPIPSSRVSSRQRRASLDEYREVFLHIPKITDRQPVFVSKDVRDKIDSIVRRLGERKMSVSGFLENLARHHLNMYADELEQWKRL